MPVHPPVLQLPPLAAVRVFEAAARHQNFTRAAAELGMTQAAVSYQIRVLEDRVGAPLFLRQPRQVSLTPLGVRLAGPLSKALSDIAAAFRDACEDSHSLLTITALHTMAINWLSPRLTRFQIGHPQFEVRVGTTEQIVDMADGSTDIALRYGLGNWPGLAAEKLFECHYAPLCTPELRERLRLRKPADLLNAPMLSPGDPCWAAFFAQSGVASSRLGGRSTMALSIQAMNVEAALRGHGVAMAVLELFADDIDSGRLVFAVDSVFRDERAYWVAYRPERLRERKIRLFRDWIVAEAEEARAAVPCLATMPAA